MDAGVAEFYRILPVLFMFVGFMMAFMTRASYWIYFVAGLFLTGATSLIIKYFFDRYPTYANRPNNINCSYINNNMPAMSGGFPSGHCQTMGFVATWFLLYALYHNFPLDIFIVILLLCAVSIWLMILSRVEHSKCHTLLQAYVGTIVGSCIGVIWWFIYNDKN
jgi:hypothetical protein